MNKHTRILFLAALFTCFALFSKAQQEECSINTIHIAENQYDIGRFNEAIQSLNHCVDNNGFNYEEKLRAYQLLALCYLAVDSEKKANDNISKLILLNDNFEADVRDPERFKLQVLFVKTQLRSNTTSSVSKKAENIELAPATIQIITAKDIQDRGYQDLEALFYDLPGFDITRTFGISYSVLYQRGYRSSALTERTMVMIDGVEDNDLWSNTAFITKQYPISNVKRVEIIYGPASTIYGANAFCGVINIVTKDEQDIFGNNATITDKNKSTKVNLNMQAGVSSYNTHYIDGTVSVKNKNVFFTVTGRVYLSDGIDLSSYSNWDGSPDFGSAAYTGKMSMKYVKDSVSRYVGPYFSVNADSSKIVPTAAGIARADSLDKAYYKNNKTYKDAATFADPVKDFYISAKLNVQNFKFGFQYWNKNEGSAGDYIDNFATPNTAYTNWQIRAYFLYARYDKTISQHFSISSFTYYRYYDYGDNSRTTKFLGFGNAGLNDYNFITGNKTPYFSTTNYSQGSNQLSSELKARYIINDKFDVLGGTEFRTAVMQANYLTSSTSPAVLTGHAGDSAGGNNLTTYTISGYVTATYHNTEKKINVDLGGRFDNNKFRETEGYGTVFNPRIAVVYYPGQFVFKGIYSEAFLDASNLNKFSTSATRLLTNPSLQPERVKNFEVSVRYKFNPKAYVELVAYRADYSHSLAVANVTLSNGVTTTQYQDIGKSYVRGLQIASEVGVGHNISIYSNLTYTHPSSIYLSAKGADSTTVPTGDIATLSANAGVNVPLFKKLNVNFRVNIVGDKETGAGTSVSTTPLSKLSAYNLFNITVGYTIVKGILAQAGCNNILNTLYYSPGVRAADGTQYASSVPQPLRNYYFRLIVDLSR